MFTSSKYGFASASKITSQPNSSQRALKLAQGLGEEAIGRREPSNALAFDGSIHRNLLAEGRLAPTPADLKDAEARERLIDAQL